MPVRPRDLDTACDCSGDPHARVLTMWLLRVKSGSALYPSHARSVGVGQGWTPPTPDPAGDRWRGMMNKPEPAMAMALRGLP